MTTRPTGSGTTSHRRAQRGRWVVAAATVVCLGVAAVVVLGPRVQPSSGVEAGAPAAGTPAPTPSSTPTPAPASSAVPAPDPTSTATAPSPVGGRGLQPTRISIPSIDVDASMVELGIARGGEVEVPSNAAQVGWVDTTPTPGQQGSSVLAGHVDSETGPAVFYRLSSLTPGDDIAVTLRDGSVSTFTVDGVEKYPQDAFPTDQVYGPSPGPVLRLITCGGDYVRSAGGYQDNVVVYAS